MESLNLLLVQFDTVWLDKTANMAALEERIWAAKNDPDVVLLPELFTTGFTMDSAPHAEMMNMGTFKWMHQISQQKQALVIGSFIAREGSQIFNRTIAMEPGGDYHTYDKRHLFRMAGENEAFSAGDFRIIIEYKGWRICPLICYDLRFPLWSRNKLLSDGQLEFDLLLYSANWPNPRIPAWDALLKARAIENQVYCAGVNRIGTDNDGRTYSGRSQIINYLGEVVASAENEEANVEYSVDLAVLKEFRSEFPVYLDADNFDLNLK